jgi:hypothetical protein
MGKKGMKTRRVSALLLADFVDLGLPLAVREMEETFFPEIIARPGRQDAE